MPQIPAYTQRLARGANLEPVVWGPWPNAGGKFGGSLHPSPEFRLLGRFIALESVLGVELRRASPSEKKHFGAWEAARMVGFPV